MSEREQARALALGLPEAVEQDHHGRPSFRVANKIFATQWDEDHMNVMPDEGGILMAGAERPRLVLGSVVGQAPRGGARRPSPGVARDRCNHA
jgi:hypothetical protein